MSFYNMINGVNPLSFFIPPMLFDHHLDEYPRFRDCFLGNENHPEDQGLIHIYTRVGGPNRDCGYGEKRLREHSNFLKTYDDPEDNTYGMYVFSVPEQHKADYDAIVAGKFEDISKDYQDKLYAIFPKLKNLYDAVFKREK